MQNIPARWLYLHTSVRMYVCAYIGYICPHSIETFAPALSILWMFALLNMRAAVIFSDNLYVGTKAIASGWGTLQEDGKPSCLLQEVEVPVMSLQDCRNTSYSPRMISDNMMCAGYREGKKDSCQVGFGSSVAFCCPLATITFARYICVLCRWKITLMDEFFWGGSNINVYGINIVILFAGIDCFEFEGNICEIYYICRYIISRSMTSFLYFH